MTEMTPQTSTLPMAQQEDGWPLGLQRLNTRVDFGRSLGLSGSISFSTLLTSTATSSLSSSSYNFEIEEMEGAAFVNGGFGTPSPPPPEPRRQEQSSHIIKKPKTWLFCLCLKPISDDEDRGRSKTITNMGPQISLGCLLEEERRAMTSIHRRS